ncbi:restriction endonuclease subunit S [Salmonella enterica subsp. salamae]|nr:restriction endonuclease subunit S [Salmonella enterica subsp. salamae]
MSKVASRRLGDLITLKRGYDLPEKVRVVGPYPVISSAGISGYHNEFKVEGPGVVTGRYGTLGEMYYAEGKYWPHNTALYVQDFKGNDPKYIYYLLGCLGRIRTSDKSAVPGVNRNELHEMEIPAISDPSVQVKVRKVLETIDKKIDLNNRINTELEAMAKTLYDYWFVQFDFPDANGKPYKTSGGKMVYNATLKREIPAGWDVKTLSQIANITMGQSPAGESYNDEGNGTLFFQGSTDFGWLFPAPRQYTTSPARMAKKGDILLSVRAPVGDMNIANADCCIGRGLAALNSKSGSDGFLFYVMKYFKQVFERRNSEGTTFGSITKNDLHSLSVAYPQSDLLKKYDDIVSDYNKMIFVRSLENQDLTKLRDWLLPLLMNGQVTVR